MASGSMVSFLAAQAMANALSAQLDAGALGAVIEIRTGAPPANVEAASTGTLLATLTASVVSFDVGADQAPNCRITAAAITEDASAVAGGTAGYYVAGSSNVADTIATKVIMGTAGEAADSTDMTLDVKLIVIGTTVAVTAWTVDVPE